MATSLSTDTQTLDESAVQTSITPAAEVVRALVQGAARIIEQRLAPTVLVPGALENALPTRS